MTLDELLKLKEGYFSPHIVVHCGSTRRARDVFEREQLADTLAGYIVLTIGAHKHDEELHLTEEQLLRLDMLHLQKIELAQTVRIFNVGGYIGESTGRELAYAQRLKKRIEFLEYAPIQVPDVPCSDCQRQALLYPCVYCGDLICRECSFDTDRRDVEIAHIPPGSWMCVECSCK